MHRSAVVLVLLASCGEPRLVMKPLPELVAAAPHTAIEVPELLLIPGESMIWDVHWRGLTIARAELVVADDDVHSKFKTGRLVSSVANAEHELTTILDRDAALPRAASERLVDAGETQRFEASFAGPRITLGSQLLAVPGGNRAHTLHSLVGVLRAWAGPGAPGGFLFLLHLGEVYRVDAERPVLAELQGTKAWRIDCRVRGSETITATVWLADTTERTPLRFELARDAERLTAELIGTSNSDR